MKPFIIGICILTCIFLMPSAVTAYNAGELAALPYYPVNDGEPITLSGSSGSFNVPNVFGSTSQDGAYFAPADGLASLLTNDENIPFNAVNNGDGTFTVTWDFSGYTFPPGPGPFTFEFQLYSADGTPIGKPIQVIVSPP